MAMQGYSTAPGRNTSVAASAPTPRGLLGREMAAVKTTMPVKQPKVKGVKNALRSK